MRSPNVSVTPINIEPYPPPILTNGNSTTTSSATTMTTEQPQRTRSAPHPVITNGGSQSVDMLDSSDAEVAQIDFQSVNMRSKKNKRDDLPRPMSWEGELSDGERDMCVDDTQSQVCLRIHVVSKLLWSENDNLQLGSGMVSKFKKISI